LGKIISNDFGCKPFQVCDVTCLSQSGFSDNEQRLDQFIKKIDDETVEIRNQYGSKIISTLRLLELTWPDDEPKPLDECLRSIDQEIAGEN
jgi:hypothetical protein